MRTARAGRRPCCARTAIRSARQQPGLGGVRGLATARPARGPRRSRARRRRRRTWITFRVVAGHEVADLVEDAVVRQVVLGVPGDDRAAVQHGDGVLRRPFGAAEPAHRRFGPVEEADDDDEVAEASSASLVGQLARSRRVTPRRTRAGTPGPRSGSRSGTSPASPRGARRARLPARPTSTTRSALPARSPTVGLTWARARRSWGTTPA